MWSCVIGLVISVSTFSWIRSAHVLKNATDKTTFSSEVLSLRSFTDISISNLWPKKHANACQQQDSFILHDIFPLYLRIHIYQIYKISTIRTKIWAEHLKLYGTTCFQIRSQIITSMFFGYVLGSYIFSSRMWKISTYLEDGKELEYTVSWLLI